MFLVAIIFYAVLGLFLGAAILHWLGLLPDPKKPGQQPANTGSPSHAKGNPATTVFVLLCAIGLPASLVWLGGTMSSGNPMSPQSSGSVGYWPASSYQHASDPVWVNGYFRRDGTYVPGHYRTRSDGDPSNNWSNYPNVNPYTGKPGTRHQAGGR